MWLSIFSNCCLFCTHSKSWERGLHFWHCLAQPLSGKHIPPSHVSFPALCTAFEKQSALFALAVLDIVMINLWVSIPHITALLKLKILVSTEIFNYHTSYRWCHDIRWEHAANRPLLRTVFQVILLLQWDTVILFSHVQSLIIICLFIKVLMRLFSPRKTTLLLVIRDKTKVCTVPGTESSFFLYFYSLIFSVCLTFLVFWFFDVFADSTGVPNTSSQGGYWEGGNALFSAFLLWSLSCRIAHQSLSFVIRYGTLFRN